MPFQKTAKIGILGAYGFIGSALLNYFKDKGYDTVGIRRNNYQALAGSFYDVFINANGNSKRFWANANPVLDFEASVVSVKKSLFDFKFEKYVLISSSDVYSHHDNPNRAKEEEKIEDQLLPPYSFNKYLAEKLVQKYCQNYLILRCSAMVGDNLKKGPIKDILDNKPLFITLDSKLQFITTNEVAKIIETLIIKGVKNEVFNVGGKGVFEFKNSKAIFNKEIVVGPEAETQHYEMSVKKLNRIFPLKNSTEYLKEFFEKYAK